MHEVELSAGVVEYEDTGGDGPVVVLVHGLMMDGSLWREVVGNLRRDHRCIVPTFPLGGHRRPMNDDADLSPRGIGLLEAEFLEALDLRDVTLAGNDSGLFQIAAAERPERIARLVITSCEAFENFPPGLPGTTVWLAGKLPGGINQAMQPMRFRPLRRLPFAWGWMAKHGIPNEVTDEWFRPVLSQRKVRRDLTKFVRAAKRGMMLDAAEALRTFDRPTLVAWAAEDRVMPPEHGKRFAELIPGARLVEIEDSWTLIPEDQPARLAAEIRSFVAGQAAPEREPAGAATD